MVPLALQCKGPECLTRFFVCLFDPFSLVAVILKEGFLSTFTGFIFCSPADRDLCGSSCLVLWSAGSELASVLAICSSVLSWKLRGLAGLFLMRLLAISLKAWAAPVFLSTWQCKSVVYVWILGGICCHICRELSISCSSLVPETTGSFSCFCLWYGWNHIVPGF